MKIMTVEQKLIQQINDLVDDMNIDKKQKPVIGEVYRTTSITDKNKYDGLYFDSVLQSVNSKGFLFKTIYAPSICVKEEGVGTVFKSPHLDNYFLIAKSLEEYYKLEDTIIPTKLVEKKVEVKVEVEKIVNVNKYDETLIDTLYNWYCKKRKRFFGEYV